MARASITVSSHCDRHIGTARYRTRFSPAFEYCNVGQHAGVRRRGFGCIRWRSFDRSMSFPRNESQTMVRLAFDNREGLTHRNWWAIWSQDRLPCQSQICCAIFQVCKPLLNPHVRTSPHLRLVFLPNLNPPYPRTPWFGLTLKGQAYDHWSKLSKSLTLNANVLWLNLIEFFLYYFSEMKPHVFYKSWNFQICLWIFQITLNILMKKMKKIHIKYKISSKNLKFPP